jgi:hypothetical protein
MPDAYLGFFANNKYKLYFLIVVQKIEINFKERYLLFLWAFLSLRHRGGPKNQTGVYLL